MRASQLLKRFKGGVQFLLKEHSGEVKLPDNVKILAFLPVYVFICLPFIIFVLYHAFIEGRYPIIPGGRVGGGGTARYVEMADHPLLFFCVWGGSVLGFTAITVVLAIKSYKGLKRILESKRRADKAEEPAPGEDLIKSRNPPQ